MLDQVGTDQVKVDIGCIHVQQEINEPTILYSLKVEKSRSTCPHRFRGNRELYESRIREVPPTTHQTFGRATKPLQRRRNHEQERNAPILHGLTSPNWQSKDQSQVLFNRLRREQSHLGLPLVRSSATTHRLEERLG